MSTVDVTRFESTDDFIDARIAEVLARKPRRHQRTPPDRAFLPTHARLEFLRSLFQEAGLRALHDHLVMTHL